MDPEKDTQPKTGLVLGALVGGITGALMRPAQRIRGSVWGVIIGALMGEGIRSLITPTPPPAPPLPPIIMPPAPPPALALASVPQLLDILVAQNNITPAQQAALLDQVKNGRNGFVGDMAVQDGLITAEVRDAALMMQAEKKAEAALQDITTIATYGPILAPAWLKANWGNNGVNQASPTASRAAGVSAAANHAQNLVMIANANPQLAAGLASAVLAATNLARGIAQGDSPRVPIARMGAAWQAEVEHALRAHPQPGVDMEAFIAARGAELVQARALNPNIPGKDSPKR